jgi:hypothetical protein
MAFIYLVDGDWYDYEDRGHWTVAAFSSLAEAERHRVKCQAWADQYMSDFWDAWAAKYGEPKERDRWGASTSSCSMEESDQRYEFIETWFGKHYVFDTSNEDDAGRLDETCGRPKMRRLSPDPLVEMEEGRPCHYSVIKVELDPTGRAASVDMGPHCFQRDFEARYCDQSKITPEFYATHLVTLRCFCGADDCPGWAAVTNDPESVARHEELYRLE